jgi:hypothetical protein
VASSRGRLARAQKETKSRVVGYSEVDQEIVRSEKVVSRELQLDLSKF